MREIPYTVSGRREPVVTEFCPVCGDELSESHWYYGNDDYPGLFFGMNRVKPHDRFVSVVAQDKDGEWWYLEWSEWYDGMKLATPLPVAPNEALDHAMAYHARLLVHASDLEARAEAVEEFVDTAF